jgi:hypothetical protein
MLGTKYAFSNLNIYFSSLFYKHNNKKGIPPRDTYYLMTILDILFYLFLTIGLKLSNSIGPRLCILVSLIIQYLSFALFVFYYENPYNALFLLAIFNIGNSLSSLTTIRNTWKYFPRYIGTINGIIISGSGISSFILSYICEFIIVKSDIKEIYKKDYYKKDLNINSKFMVFIYIIGCILVFCGLLSFLFCIEYREEIILKTRLNDSESDSEEDISDYDLSQKDSFDNSKLIKAEISNGLFSCKNLQLIFLGFFGLCKYNK